MSFDQVTRSDLAALMRERGPHKVSIFLPTAKAGPQTRENPIRLKNLLRTAEEELAATGMRPTLAKDLVSPGYDLEEVREFHQDLGEGLALFLDDKGMRRFRLPVSVPEVAVVSDRFDVKPLLQLFGAGGAYYLLALSMNDVRAFRAHHFDIHELRVEGMPRSMAEALWPDDADKQLQFRSTGAGVMGRGTAVFHSSGDQAADRLKEDIGRYFKMVDNAFTKAVDDDSTPLVLAGVDYLHPIYREVSKYKTLLADGVEGSPDRERPEDLAARAWPLVQQFYDGARREDAERFGNLTGTGKASTSLGEVIDASRRGRVETMWVTAGEQRWGCVAEDGAVVEHDRQEPGDDDLLDLAGVETLSNSGKVYVVERAEVPNGEVIAAIFRY